ncbi:DUF4908 domain-containing protein [Caulobacter sp. RL271]|jgi:hypothetical protein|uniref:DUF4908 domain-containing protein n=1 Tax=Caulobacter segnis TaxID=88688 RepID=A0ABY4ZWF7_9CAUL|nr:DUF4908 domain-containing protein [Caulobacter segnis]USQ96494.1 DUF4908 domain-containing protein [Caulobacter segnis]
MKFCKAELGDWGAKATLAIAALMVMAASANAQQLPHSLRDALLGHKGSGEARRVAAPPVARYVSEAGGGFIFDQASPQPLMKFDNSAEVWVLSAQQASRGDVIYRNDLGEPVLRVTKLGGVILFTDDAPMGAAAALSGRASSIQPPAILSFSVFVQRVRIATARASRAAQRDIEFSTVQDVRPETSVLAADTATVVAEAFERMARKGDRSLISRIARVLLAEGRKPAASLKDGSLTITYSPDQGVAGRPSSKRIIKVINR